MAKEQGVPDYSTPNKKKRFVEAEYQRILKAVNSVNPDREYYIGGIFGTRRQKAIMNVLDRAEKEFRSFGLVSVVETFTKNELMPFNNYNYLDGDADLRIGAALWILDKLRESGAIREAFDILPDVSGDKDAFYLPINFAHPCYANDLIQSVIHVITNRYGKQRGVVITEGNACRKKPGEAYQKLLDLLPREDVQKASEEFKAKVWELAGRFMKGQSYFDKEIERTVREMRNIQAAPVSTLAEKKGLPGVSGSIGIQDAMFDIARRGQELIEQSHDYSMDFDRYLWMDRKAVRRETGSREIADAAANFTVNDPYELCFALFYLMDTGDDAPWLIRSGSSLMLYALRMLPWYVDQDDWDDEDFEAWYDGFQYNREGWLEQEKVEEPLDFYHERHGDRNLAQVVYDLCRTVVPTGLHPFEKDRQRLVAEGMEEDKARKITDIAELLFLYEFQTRQRVKGDFSWEDEDDESDATVTQESATTQTTAQTQPLAKLKVETDELKKQLKSLKNALAVTRQEANNERAKYEHELKALRMEHRELADLRELVFNSELSPDIQERREKPEKNYQYPYSPRKRTVIFGGHDSFLRAIKPMLPDVKFVDASAMTYSPEIIRNADVVWIQNNCISHPQYWSIVKNCKLAGVQMRYFGFASAEKCAEQLVTEDLN